RDRTRVKMLSDEAYFYVGAELEEPHVWAKLSQHDAVIFHDNDFKVFIDPDGDNHEYYEFEINALNTSWDLFLERPYKDGGRAQNDWEIPGLKTAVHVDGRLNDSADVDRGWSIEIAFPWKDLGQYAQPDARPCALAVRMEIYHSQRTVMKHQGTLGRLARRARTRLLRESPFHAAPGDHAARRRLSSERRASRGPAARALERSPGLADLA